ncbi:hypothetical protein HELRODRAFT_158785 [Helobdella robusta]|uniref:Endonuclease/exonuclease/phosphatase domain-containing protein n=1 Tax=Helobdella robusta TaxID=6412 RepID=T1EN94_HELRO|nr:hypothetical protein HELRODRAFT_158785 [Helobdella robusta]ESO12300.1 hypothetical protein HELRODRAFT_158785 [Helobdella robusta]
MEPVIQVYAPTSESSEEDLEAFHSDLDDALETCKSQKVVIVMGDLNSKVGSEKIHDVVGPHGIGERNVRGEKLIEWRVTSDQVITNTWFENKLGRVPETSLLKIDEIKVMYNVEVRNRFQLLTEDLCKSKYKIFKDALTESAKRGHKRIRDVIVSRMGERRKTKEKWLNDKCEFIEKIKNNNTNGKKACTVFGCIKAKSDKGSLDFLVTSCGRKEWKI